MSQIRAVLRDQRGFTLTELLVVAAVLGMILGAVVLVQQQGQQAYIFGSHRVEVQQNNRAALELMVRELRSAEAVTALGSATDITFRDVAGATVRYQLTGNTLNRTAAGVGGVLIGGVQSLTFTYYAAGFDPVANTGPTTTVAADLKAVRIQIITRPERPAGAGTPGDQRATVESTVMLRNG